MAALSGADVRRALTDSRPVDTPVGAITYFSRTCHKIVDYPMAIVEVSGGSMRSAGTKRVDRVPDIGDGNSCAAGAGQ
ncbi:hypothetical protein OHA40_27290 [Nocardia sp. NBC_00508]|uniref:hypothetical protein n=1 Tax=Nocardia sp. NBC_00508 TaxID=2975992 RepID=UPI002E81D31B|nr:hypothetical protein [Nocardia sp. NBC_00508]WUD65305.1 hypothetical protein OHA40_27290 [Nocardia sp. NBC_00508]